jgi:hypothetical protein
MVCSAQMPRNGGVNGVYGKLPVTFEPNQGQTSSQVKFLSRGPGYEAFLTTGDIVLSLRATAVGSAPSSPEPGAATTVQFTLVGAAKSPTVAGEDLQPGRVNYFFGDDPAEWRTNVPTYGRVRYKNVYPGIDLVYYGSRQQLEYDFEIRPGSDPHRIQFEIQGANQIELDSGGNLVLRLGKREIRFQSPIVYQQSKGQRTPVQGSYVMTDSTHIAFEVAHYDSSKSLVIDPVLVYSTYLGGTGTDQPTGIAVDSTGSVYVVGYTNSVDFPLTTTATLAHNANHVFVAKLDPAGANLVYADYIGGDSDDSAAGLVLDSANEVYVTGGTASSNFPVVRAYQPQKAGPYTGFLTRVSADGSALLYSTYLGGSTFDQPTSIAIDSLGQVHVAGYTASQNFPLSNAYQSMAFANQAGMYGYYGFLTKFSVDGSSLVYSTYLAGNSNVAQACGTDQGHAPFSDIVRNACWPAPYSEVSALSLDSNGNAYVAGTTNTYNFPVTAGAYLTNDTAPANASVGFVSRISSMGNLDYSTYFYGSSGNSLGIAAIAVDGASSAYIAGSAASDGSFPVTSASICDPGTYGFGCSYAFVTKLDPTEATLLYSTFLGPNNFARPRAIALDHAGNAYVLASTSSGLFQTNDAIEAYTSKEELLLVKIDSAATTQLLSTYFGGNGNDAPGSIALDAADNIYIAGSTDSNDLPVTQGAFQSRLGGNTNTFAVKIGAAPAPAISVAGVSLSPPQLAFPSTPVAVSSAAQAVTLTNLENTGLSIASVQVTGDYAQTNNCPATLATQANCTFNITFTPTTSGSRNGTLSISDSAIGSPQSVPLSGTGVDFSLTVSPASATVNAGATATYTLTVAPVGGAFTNAIKLACSQAPIDSNCQLSSTSVTPGPNSVTATLTISTTAPSAGAVRSLAQKQPFLAVWMQLQALALFGIMIAGPKRRKKNAPMLIAIAVLVAALLLLSACAGGTGIAQQQGTPPGTYPIMITGTSGALQHSTTLTLIVQ